MTLLRRLYDSLNRRDSDVMAACYHAAATFHDIAFDLKGKEQIHAMWRMICSGDISATFKVVRADDHDGVVKAIDEYTFTETGRRVRNPIESRFQFRDGLIVEHRDHCNARAWGAAALGGVGGFLAGRFRFLRAWRGRSMLQTFIQSKA